MIGASAARSPSDSGIAEGGSAIASRRFFDNASAAWMVKVLPGEYYVTTKLDEVLVTVLGSCVSACIRDPIKGIGGMNHFMLPHSNSGSWAGDTQSTRFGNFAIGKSTF